MWVESELSTIKIGGKLVIQAIIQDITEKKLAEEKLKESERILRQQNIELKELDRLKTDFISIAAHELYKKNGFTIIDGSVLWLWEAN